MSFDSLEGKHALIIGGTSGIGVKLAELLLLHKVELCVTGRHAPDRAAACRYIPLDFSRFGLDALRQADCADALERCDILVVSYGPFVRKPVHETSLEDWQLLAQMDYALPGAAVSAVLPRMMARKEGAILLFGGTRTDSVRPYRTNAAYAGAKTGLSVLVKSVAAEYGRYGIRCNAILPGFVTERPESESAAYDVSADSIAQKALFLLLNDDLNGVLLTVDKGWSAGMET